ncbi:MAG TPA: adenylate/guanylate cyclase domain-containing protein [Waterburya sp.]|jgi:PAS domain S-box-containing protein
MSSNQTGLLRGEILVVDDTPDNLRLLSTMLTEQGYTVRKALSGQMALMAAQTVLPDLIVLDINMPGMNGYEVCTQLKAEAQTREVPVIFISALDDVWDKVKAFSVGGVDYISKPFHREEVLARVENQLKIRSLALQLQSQNSQLQQEICDRIKAEESMRLLAEREKLLSQIAQRIRQSLDLEEILTRTVSEVRQFLQTDRVVIYQLEPDGSGAIAQESVSREELSIINTPIHDPCFQQTYIQKYVEGRFLAIQDIHTAELQSCHLDFLVQLQVRANLVVPILQTNTERLILKSESLANPSTTQSQKWSLYGLLIAHHCSGQRQWHSEEIDLLRELSIQIGIAVQQGQLYQQLYQAEQRYHSIVENAIAGIFQSTPSGRYLSANPALAKLYGYNSPEELLSSLKNIWEQLYVNPNRRHEFVKAMEANNAVFGFESQVYRKDGSIIWILENTRAVRDSMGNLLYYEGTVTDITERKLITEALRSQQEKTEKLLLNILPSSIAQRLKQEQSIIADHFEAVTVMFADIVGFTELSARKSPTELVEMLNVIFSKFDQLAEQHELEKIKTIGDAYMVVAGLPTPRTDHAEAIAEMALDIQAEIKKLSFSADEPFNLRIGINSGPVVAGVIGIKKFIYDLWGDTVNIANRMESQGIADAIQVTTTTYDLLRHKYEFQKRGVIPIKGKGKMTTYMLTGRK